MAGNELRLLQLGDSWDYLVSGDAIVLGEPVRALRGTISVKVVADTLIDHPGSIMIVFVQALEIEATDAAFEPLPAPELAFSFLQDPMTRDAAILADNMGRDGTCRRAERPQLFYPGRWSRNTRYDNRLEFEADDFVRNTMVVTGAVTVDTPLGKFETWVAAITSHSPAMGETTGADWWVPELGAPACFDTTTTRSDGGVMRLHAVLTQTSVPLQLASTGERVA